MAANTFWSWWKDCEFTEDVRPACEAAWDAATKAAEEKFTSTNKQSTQLQDCIICGAKKVSLNPDSICRKCAK